MKTIEYLLSPPEQWYQDLHQQLPSSLHDNQLIFDRSLGRGSMQFSYIQEGIWIHQMDFEFNQPVSVCSKPKPSNDCFAIYFYLSNTDLLYEYSNQSYTLGLENVSILLTSAAADTVLTIPSNKPVRIFSIGFDREWMKDNIIREEANHRLVKLFLSDHPIYIFENLDFKFRAIIEELNRGQVPKLRLFSHVLQLMDYLVVKLNQRSSDGLVPANIYHHDFQELLKAKSLLEKDLEQSVPVEELAAQAGMSLSKFKRLFKEVFGTSPYKHYLKNRMEKAMDLLMLKEKTISEVGFIMGYSNLSQFSKAFKNHHGVLPSEVR